MDNLEKCGDAVRLCRDGVKKAEVQLELDLARGAKKCEKGFCRYTEQEGPGGCTLLPPVSNIGRLGTGDREEAEVVNSFFYLSLHWQLLYTQPSSEWFGRWELVE